MTTDQLLDHIAKRGLLTPEQIVRVRGQVAKSAKPVSPKALAKHLVDTGMLTLAQAQSLLTPPVKPKPAPKPAPAEDDFGLAPLDDAEELDELEELEELEEIEELVELEELEELVPLEPAAPAPKKPAPRATVPPTRQPAPPAKPAKPATPAKPTTPAQPSALLDELVELESAGPFGGGPLDLLSGNAALAAEGNPLLAPPKKKGLRSLFGSSEPKKRKPGESEWESPLMLFGGGALLLLVLVGAGVFFLYLRGSGDQQFKLAEEDYRAGSYTQAIEKYTKYLDKNPKHPSVSLAKVHRGLARLRRAAESNNYGSALKEAQTVVSEIQNEKEFPEARLEFRSILPDIAEGLAKEAAAEKDPTAVKAKLAEAEDALKLVMNVNYVPQAQRPIQRIAAIRETMALASREVDREAELEKTLTAMKSAVDKRDIAAAYAARKQLLRAYPDLAGNSVLATGVVAVTEGEKQAVQILAEGKPAETKEPPSPIVAQVALAARKTPEVSGKGPTIALLVRGAVYGFDSGSGKLLWRRYVGLDSQTPPLAIDSNDEADLLVVDAARNELVRVAANDGKLVWRQPLGERIAGAIVAGKQAVVSTFTGKLVAMDLKTGDVLRTAILPQETRLRAATTSSGSIYQIGQQSTIYVLNGDLACQQAFYLGHETGTVSVPPVALPKHLVVVENRGAKSCTLHALAVSDDGKIAKDVQKFDLPGHILTPPVIADRKLVVMTDGGHIKVMSVNASNLEQPLADLADQPAARGETPTLRHLLVDGGNLWIADKHLVRYKVQSAAGRLMPSPLEDDYGTASFEQPLATIGTMLVHARHPTGSPSVLVAGTNLADGRRLWETQIATPPAGEPIGGGETAVVTASGQLFSLNDDAWKRSALDQLATNDFDSENPLVLATRTELKDGTVVFTSDRGDARMFAVSAAKDSKRGRALTAPEPLACPPAAFGKGLIVPTSIGQVFWLNPGNGKPVAEPFQPQVSAGSNVKWTTPDATGDGKEFVIANGPRVYRVTLVREPAPHLEAVATSEELAEPIVTPIAVLGSAAIAADSSGRLRVFSLPDLTTDQPIDLGGSVVWGPRRIGKHALLATANDELVCLDADAKIAWRQTLEHGPLAGTPALAGGELIISLLSGHVMRLAMEDGKTLAIEDVGQPLATGPVSLENRWLVATNDGTLLVIEPPSEEAR